MNAPPNLVVVKVGGSLYDHPRLGEGLSWFLESLHYHQRADQVLIVPGGGAATDVIRELESRHQLLDNSSHWLAIEMLRVMKRFLAAIILPHYGDCTTWLKGLNTEDLYGVKEDDLPRSWEVTSDSIAAHTAKRKSAFRLILLKSTDIPPGTPWPEAAARGWVDAYFPTAVADATFPIEAINFRKWLDERFPAGSGG